MVLGRSERERIEDQLLVKTVFVASGASRKDHPCTSSQVEPSGRCTWAYPEAYLLCNMVISTISL